MCGGGGGPQAEPIVVLGRQDEPLQATGLGGCYPLVRIKGRGIEHRRILVAKTPFAIGEGIGGEMNETIHATTVRGELAVTGDRSMGNWQ